MSAVSGFAHPDYVASLREFGEPRVLPRSGGGLLLRRIPGSDLRDAMGPYPVFSCQDWTALGEDLDALALEVVTVTVGADPFGASRQDLEGAFDRVVPLKEHYVADLSQDLNRLVKASHRETVRRAQRRVRVELHPDPPGLLETWMDLYGVLTVRHGITGIRAFSREAFARQLAIPGMTAFVAYEGPEVVCIDLWYQQGEVVQGHLAAASESGYGSRAMYATKWAMLEHFRTRARWVNFGGGAGTGEAADGLTRFKAGWSSGTRTAFLGCRVLQPDAYARLVSAAGGDPAYFPAYRAGEFS